MKKHDGRFVFLTLTGTTNHPASRMYSVAPGEPNDRSLEWASVRECPPNPARACLVSLNS